MAKINPRYVSTFRAPTEYERQLEEARRRAAMAEALAQQEYQPMEGTAAPIPAAAPLVKALQGFMTARAGRQAQEAAEAAKGLEETYAQRMLGRMEGGYTSLPNAELQAQMAKRSDETLDQYNQRIQNTQFTGRPVSIPEQTELAEITRQSQYKRSPEETLAMASTGLGAAALKDRPFMAARLAQMLETPKEAEYGTTPQFDSEGRAFVVNKAGGIRYLNGVSKAPETTELQRNYEYAKGQGYTGSFDDFRKSGIARTTVDVRYGAPVSGVDAEGNPVFFQPNPTGGPPSIIQGVRPEGKGPTESQSTARLYVERMAESEPVFESLTPPSYGLRAKEGLPGGVGNVMLTPESRQWFQAERNFINAVLRKESGAVISEAEFDNARKQYIPQPGDDPQTKEQKRRNRQTAIREIGGAAGPGYRPPAFGNLPIIDLPSRR